MSDVVNVLCMSLFNNKKAPICIEAFLERPEKLLRGNARCVAFAASHGTGPNHPESAEAHQQIDNPFNCRPLAQKKIDDIEIGISETTKSYQAPVDAADEQQNLCNP